MTVTSERDRRISRNVAAMALSAIKEMAIRSAAVPDAASLTWGVPSFRTPEHIRAAVARGLESDPDIGKYALPDGVTALRELAARRHRAETEIDVSAADDVLITAGNMQGLNTLFHVLIDPGDEVILTDPGFVSHIQQITMCGGTPVHWAMDEARGWALDLDALAKLITPRTKAIVLVSPSNPTGKIFSESELRRIGELARRHDLFILLDDPYSLFAYGDGTPYFNLASVPDLRDHIAYLFTFSKVHAMSGWRVGYMIVPRRLRAAALKVHDTTMICVPRISQVAAIAALGEPAGHIAEFTQILARRRDLICARLDRLAHVFDYVRPEGAYYVFPRIHAEHVNSLEFSLRLLDEAKVTVTPGRGFGPAGEHHVRMAFCVDDDIIERAFDRLDAYFAP